MDLPIRLTLGGIASSGVSGRPHPHLESVFGSSAPPDFRLSDELLHTHLAVFGGTRRGKSKLFELLMRQLIEAGRGLAFLDPHSDTADDLFAYLAFHQDEYGYLCNRLHYLRPDDRAFCFDPFAYHGAPPEDSPTAESVYRRWLHGKILDVIAILLRNRNETSAEQAKMTRMKTWLYNGLFAVGIRQADGSHLPLSDLFVLLNPKHRRHEQTYHRVEPFLSDQVRADFEMLRSLRSPGQIQDFVESTFNQLRQVITPTTERVFSTDRPTIDFHRIVRNGEILLASLGRTTLFHHEEGIVLAGLIIREISEAVRTVPRAERNRFFLFLDEAQNFLGEDLQDLLKESGKYKLSCGLAVQSLDNLQQLEMDLVPAVLGQCNLQITFQQQYFPHAELLAKCLCYPWLDFTELLHEVDRDDGYEWTVVKSSSRGTNYSKSTQQGTSSSRTTTQNRSKTAGTGRTNSATRSKSWSRTAGTSNSTGTNSAVTLSAGRTQSQNWSDSHGTNQSETHGYSSASGTATSQSKSMGETAQSAERHTGDLFFSYKPSGRSRGVYQGHGVAQTQSTQHGVSESSTEGRSESHSAGGSESTSNSVAESSGESTQQSESQSQSDGGGTTEGNSTSETESRTRGTSRGRTEGQSTSKGESHGSNESVTETLTPLRKTRVESQRTGSLQTSVNDQDRMHTSVIQSLPTQHCLVAVGNQSFVLRVADVSDPFQELAVPEDLREDTVLALKRRVFAREDYFMPVDFEPRLEEAKTPPASQEPSSGFDLG